MITTPQRRILELLLERGPLSDDSLAGEIADQWDAEKVAPLTASLEADGLIEPSEFAPDRWQITDAGRKALESDEQADSGAAWVS